jgi:hypothetical protein
VLRAAAGFVTAAALVGLWFARPTSSATVRTINPAAPSRIHCRITDRGVSNAVVFDFTDGTRATVRVGAYSATFSIRRPSLSTYERLRVDLSGPGLGTPGTTSASTDILQYRPVVFNGRVSTTGPNATPHDYLTYACT